MIEIYNWSIRKVIFRHSKVYEPYLVGYAPTLDTFGIAAIERFYISERLIEDKNSYRLYSLCGMPDLTNEAEKFWSETKQFARIIYDLDISYKYIKKLNPELFDH
jgi:hypothetical protein